MNVGCAHRGGGFKELVDPAYDRRAAGEVAQALEVGEVRIGEFGGNRIGRILARRVACRHPAIDLAAHADSGMNTDARLERDGGDCFAVERIGHDETDRTVVETYRSDALGAQVICLQHAIEMSFGREVGAADQRQVARGAERAGEMFFINKVQLEEEQIHPVAGMLRHGDRARMLLRRQQPVRDQPADRVRRLTVAF